MSGSSAVWAALAALLGGYGVWRIVTALRSGSFGAWDRDTHPANYWLGTLLAACLVVLALLVLLGIVLPGSPRPRAVRPQLMHRVVRQQTSRTPA